VILECFSLGTLPNIFVSSVDIGSANLLKVPFHLMFTLFL
jgi:hypothetical protein